jgi:hypothetical protein
VNLTQCADRDISTRVLALDIYIVNCRKQNSYVEAFGPRSAVGAERLAAARFSSHGKLSLMPPNVKNQTNAKMSNGDAFGSSIRPAIRKPSKPATPKIVTTNSAVVAVHIIDRRPIPVPRLINERMVTTALENQSKRAAEI